MRPQVVSQTGTGSSSWVVLDHHQNPFSVSLAVVVSGTVNYTVEHTFDNVLDSTVTPTAFTNEYLDALTANADGNYMFPVVACRVTVNSGAGSATLTSIQAGSF